jgi:hypothetical protein
VVQGTLAPRDAAVVSACAEMTPTAKTVKTIAFTRDPRSANLYLQVFTFLLDA